MKILILLCMTLQLLPSSSSSEEGLAIIEKPTNCTVLVNTKAILTCRVSGKNVQVIWQKLKKESEVFEMPRKGKNFRILRTGSLKFANVTMTDRGRYRCIVQNSHGELLDESSFVWLEVQAIVEIPFGRGPTDRNVNFGTIIELQCEAVGIPLPEVVWTKNGNLLTDKFGNNLTDYVIYVNATEKAIYECTAKNHHIFGTDVIKRSATVTIIDTNNSKGNKVPKGKCVKYTGSICKSILGNKQVFDDESFKGKMAINEETIEGLQEELDLVGKTNPYCKLAAAALLCHYAFPDCNLSHELPSPAPICREECELVKNKYCLKEWSEIERNKKIGIYMKNRRHIRLPDCNNLPQIQNKTIDCSGANIYVPPTDKITSECYNENGQYYNGTVNKTKSGKICRMWMIDISNTATTNEVLPDLFNQNYCRNPGGSRSKPWCYYSSTEKEECNVPKCIVSNGVKSEPISKSSTMIIIAVGVFFAVVFIILFIIACYKGYVRHNNIHYNVTHGDEMEINFATLPRNVIYHKSSSIPTLNPKLDYLEYPRNSIVYLRDIGHGGFGQVFQAFCPGLVQGHDSALIAVRMLKEDGTDEMQQDFEREASLMVEFSHKNIVSLLGVCAIGKPMCLLLEYMSKGDLNVFLRHCNTDDKVAQSHDSFMLPTAQLHLTEKLFIASQIASAMLYITQKGYVHRDLATRNCLVGEHLIVKISDFRLMRAVDSGDQYEGSESDALAVRWMPLESILFNQFSHKSDVWSFGVSLWEIFSFAQQPYCDKDHEEVISYLKEENMLECPDSTPSNIYAIMRQCWSLKSNQRPTFSIIHRTLFRLLEASKTRSDLT